MADGADDDQEKSLPASERRLEQAREEGQVPRSRALATALIMMTAIGGMSFAGPLATTSLANLMSRGLTLDHETAFREGAMGARLTELVLQAMVLVVPVGLALALVGAAAYLLVGGILFSPNALQPKFSKLDPIKGIANMFSARGLAELAKTLLEVTLVVIVAGAFVYGHLNDFPRILSAASDGPLKATGELVVFALLAMLGALVVSALVDVPLQIWKHGHGLRMSLEEVKRESRETEGDPHLKARIRSQQRDMAKKRMMQEVPKADVVVTNPTRYAVALKYDEGGQGAPRVVAKGTDLIARRIRELATGAGVPLVEAPPLARALFARAEIGDEVPQALYTAVAQVLAFVYRLRAESAPVAAEPYALDAVEIPPGLDPLEGRPAVTVA